MTDRPCAEDLGSGTLVSTEIQDLLQVPGEKGQRIGRWLGVPAQFGRNANNIILAAVRFGAEKLPIFHRSPLI
jgi:hypothetical protein